MGLRLSRCGSLSASKGQEKLACPNEALLDYFVKVRLWKWSSVGLFCESQIVKVKFCQFKLWKLYCNDVVLSGKMMQMFRTKLLILAEI